MSEKVVEVARGGVHSRRNNSLDALKFVAAIFVVFIHFPLFTGEWHGLIQRFAFFAVPVFFMCSGFFCYGKTDVRKTAKKAARIALITVITLAIYIIYDLARGGAAEMAARFTVRNILFWVCFNVPFVASCTYHIWFLYALIYTYLIWMIITRLKLNRFAFWIALGILILQFVAENVCALMGSEFPVSIARSVWFSGLPFFLMGYAINEHKQFVKKLSAKIYAGVLAAACALTVAEFCIENFTPLGSKLDLLGATRLLAVALFALAVKYDGPGENPLSAAGRELSMILYILHPLIGDMLLAWGIFDGFPFAITLCTIAACLIVAVLVRLCVRLVGRLRNKGVSDTAA